MRKLWLVGLAASAAIAPAAIAQTVADPEMAQSVAAASLKAPVAAASHAAASAGHRGPMRDVVREVRRAPVASHWRDRVPHIPRDRRAFEFRRIHRGGILPTFWMGPQFHVRNWGLHGFPAPVSGRRWIRYYDDALLVDGRGRVHDGRYGWDWDRDGDRWGYRDGIPVYVGDGDFEPDDRDYEWAEDWERGREDDYAEGHHGPMPGDCRSPCTRTYHGPPPPPPGHGMHGGYGCGCGPVVVTETITTTAPVVEERVVYEYVTETVTPKRHYRRAAKPVRRAPARRPAPPRPGERG